ncbi:NADH-quinone oxidoreductase subunit N [Oryzomonas sagensis]|uniref:NADH-quinone oxidoreductase subunit N n=1 Tax=Oryzomonas sagensis TaxID=2603857 RepID=A0ABQ6TR66_9BACT|nr:NADH-quinone oxidoreductase subunit N [Oryzomonas sagensis]KAB0671294.1 NADH-quinone oxidoreductase subunit N [Oryzomonas sagensis]
MTNADLMAFMPLIILAGGSVVVLLAGAVRPGGWLYELALAFVVAALVWTIALPANAVMPGLAVTPFSRFFAVFLDSTGLVALLLASGYNKRRGIVGEEYPATLLFALAGMGAACAATDLLMLFLGLEAFTFAFYILVAVERDSVRGGEAGLKYLLNGTLSAAILAMGIALVYCSRGTLKLAELALQAAPPEPLFLAGVCMVLVGLAFKLSWVPAHLWTPDVYQGAPAPVTALLSTASKGASAAAVLLVLPLAAVWRGGHDILWGLALATLVCGNLAALVQSSIKRLLAWSSVAQMGYVALAFVALPAGGARAALFYIVAYAAAGLASFGAVAVLSDGTDRDAIEQYRGLGYRNPLAGAALAVALFSLTGIPPAVGFMAKFAVFSAALRAGETALAVVGALSALVAVFFYLRVVVALYMRPADGGDAPVRRLSISESVALAIPTAAILFLGLSPSPLLDVVAHILRLP